LKRSRLFLKIFNEVFPKFDTYVTRQLPFNGDRQFDPLVYQCIVRLPNVRAHACVDEDEDVDKDVDMDVDEDVRVFVLLSSSSRLLN